MADAPGSPPSLPSSPYVVAALATPPTATTATAATTTACAPGGLAPIAAGFHHVAPLTATPERPATPSVREPSVIVVTDLVDGCVGHTGVGAGVRPPAPLAAASHLPAASALAGAPLPHPVPVTLAPTVLASLGMEAGHSAATSPLVPTAARPPPPPAAFAGGGVGGHLRLPSPAASNGGTVVAASHAHAGSGAYTRLPSVGVGAAPSLPLGASRGGSPAAATVASSPGLPPAPLPLETKVPVSLIRCIDRDVCAAPMRVPLGRIAAPTVGTRESKLLWPRPLAAPPAHDATAAVAAATAAAAAAAAAVMPNEPAVAGGGKLVAAASLNPRVSLMGPPRRVLVVKKWKDEEARDAAEEVAEWLHATYGVHIIIHEDVSEPPATRMAAHWTRWAGAGACAVAAAASASAASAATSLTTAPASDSVSTGGSPRPDGMPFGSAPVDDLDLPRSSSRPGHMAGDEVDLIITIGGDGTVLHTSGMFQCAMPPVVSVAYGSLGFMTAHSLRPVARLLARIFEPAAYRLAPAWPPASPMPGTGAILVSAPVPLVPLVAPPESLPPATRAALDAGPQPIAVSLRMRLRVDLYTHGSVPGRHPPAASHVVLNELLLERGPR